MHIAELLYLEQLAAAEASEFLFLPVTAGPGGHRLHGASGGDPMSGRFEGRTALVTGASSGIGPAPPGIWRTKARVCSSWRATRTGRRPVRI
ncbi:hypothetical protein GCM10022214_00440 [Actinomadura miaoliensis]|uniref:SDR family NAD(P)-dependent oxidoreductase n=2 Tax=Actinomadura miaoliensis TaxID=430685 RepID=A0ABP7UVK6_9ACTN